MRRLLWPLDVHCSHLRGSQWLPSDDTQLPAGTELTIDPITGALYEQGDTSCAYRPMPHERFNPAVDTCTAEEYRFEKVDEPEWLLNFGHGLWLVALEMMEAAARRAA